MKTLIRGLTRLLSLVALSGLVVAQGAWALDLSGEWVLKDSSIRIYIFQSGNNVEAVFSYRESIPPFKTGDRTFYGTLEGNTLTGKIAFGYDTNSYGLSHYGNMIATVSADGNTLERKYDPGSGWVAASPYIRKITTTSGSTNDTCTAAATLDSNLNMHIPGLIYQPLFGNPMNLWVDLQFSPAADSSLTWKLSNYGVNP